MSWKPCLESDEGKFCCIKGKISLSGFLLLSEDRKHGILVKSDGRTKVDFKGIESNDWIPLTQYSVVLIKFQLMPAIAPFH
jgi:hypothetical protein